MRIRTRRRARTEIVPRAGPWAKPSAETLSTRAQRPRRNLSSVFARDRKSSIRNFRAGEAATVTVARKSRSSKDLFHSAFYGISFGLELARMRVLDGVRRCSAWRGWIGEQANRYAEQQ
jgi:hypothetical protein